MRTILVTGWGAVSPAGFGVEALMQAIHAPRLIPRGFAQRPSPARAVPVHRVPPSPPRSAHAAHPRLRRASPITQWTLAAAEEALAMDPIAGTLGIVFCTTCGGVQYSRRFFEEVLTQPAFASPILFPETVLNAPSSHLGTILQSVCVNYTLNGDANVFLEAILTAAAWLETGRVDRCLVVAAEESDWLTGDVLSHFGRRHVLAEGAGALLLRQHSASAPLASLDAITEPFPLSRDQAEIEGVHAAAKALTAGNCSRLETELLALGGNERPRTAAAIESAFAAWPKPWVRVKPVLGEGLAAGAAWQTIAGLHSARSRNLSSCAIPILGNYQELTAARFRVLSPTEPAS